MTRRWLLLTPPATPSRPGMADVVLDASAVVDLLLGNTLGQAVAGRMRGEALHGPAHLDGEVLSALGRLHRAGELAAETAETHLRDLAAAPIEHHPLAALLLGAWHRRQRVRLADAVYLELAVILDCPLVTTDRRLRSEPHVEVVDAV